MDRDEFLRIKGELKETLKSMALQQIENKKRWRRDWGYAAEITAVLNYYHEFRGSDYRHGTEGIKIRGGEYNYARRMKELREKYDVVPVV